VTFQVLSSAIIKLTVLWDIVPCSVTEIDRRFKDDYCLHHQVVALITQLNISQNSHFLLLGAAEICAIHLFARSCQITSGNVANKVISYSLSVIDPYITHIFHLMYHFNLLKRKLYQLHSVSKLKTSA
jgi:hypothetical protein